MSDDENVFDQVRTLYDRRFGEVTPTPAEYEDPPFTRARAAAFVEDGAQPESVKWVVSWQMKFHTGSFSRALEQAIMYADESNLMRLYLGYPHEVAGFLSYRMGKLAERLQAAGILHMGGH